MEINEQSVNAFGTLMTKPKENGTAVHLWACGWGKKTVTPISPTEWQLTGMIERLP